MYNTTARAGMHSPGKALALMTAQPECIPTTRCPPAGESNKFAVHIRVKETFSNSLNLNISTADEGITDPGCFSV